MNKIALKNSKESVPLLASLFQCTQKPVYLSVKEDLCFGDKWLNLGEISIKPAPKENGDEENIRYENAISLGFYEWSMSGYEQLYDDCLKLLGFIEGKDTKNEKSIKDKTRRSLEAIIDVIIRMGLYFPHFDPIAVKSMPFRRPTTIVADTNAIMCGGVDFLLHFLYPMARLKIPAIVVMEIFNRSDNFFSKRRHSLEKEPTTNQKVKILYDHVRSQAAQRALLRFEVHSDIEIERTSIIPDPLRNAFQKDHDQEQDWQSLHLSAPVKSYCDRLILETTRQHIMTGTPGHPVMLMTADETLARMALAEGVSPFYFHAGRIDKMYGRLMTGTCFHPFTGEAFSVPLEYLLWELAVTFGNARLASEDGSVFFEVCAIHHDLRWQPFHVQDDLLSVSWGGGDKETLELLPVSNRVTIPPDTNLNKQKKQITTSQEIEKQSSRYKPNTVYRFDLKTMVNTISTLVNKKTVPATGEGTPLQNMGERTTRRYLDFLIVGHFVTKTSKGIQSNDTLHQLWNALMKSDFKSIIQLFRVVPSFAAFLDELTKNKVITSAISKAYIQIAEMCSLAIQIPQSGVYSTATEPSLEKFVELSIQVYEELKKDQDYISTGAWLEKLACQFGFHPLMTRKCLEEARKQGLVERYTQGSTPDTRFEKHTLTMLQVENGRPEITQIRLYHGGFIIPGKASVSIRLGKK